jgi:hypothetical protein
LVFFYLNCVAELEQLSAYYQPFHRTI